MSTPDDESFIILGSSPPASIQPAQSLSPSMSTLAPIGSDSTLSSLRSENSMLRDTLRDSNAALRDRLALLSELHSDVRRTQHTHKHYFNSTKLLIQQLRTENSALRSELEQEQANCRELEESRRVVSALQTELAQLRLERGERDALTAQLQLYREDFELERECRARLAGEKDEVELALVHAQAHNRQLIQQLELVNQINPDLYKRVTSQKVYTCPKCESVFVSLALLEKHVDVCVQ